jgi:hypothetical protein
MNSERAIEENEAVILAESMTARKQWNLTENRKNNKDFKIAGNQQVSVITEVIFSTKRKGVIV